MTSSPVLLILGGGPRVGSSVAKKFLLRGFRVATASRSVQDSSWSPEGYLLVQVDLSQPRQVPRVFEVVKSTFGTAPSVIVYNGAKRVINNPEDPFSLGLAVLTSSITVGFESLYVAAQEAIKGFAEMPESIAKTFIFTGNALNQVPIPPVFSFAVSKRAASTLVEYGANAYASKGYRFYYTDERNSLDGRPAGEDIDGEAHAEMYWKLAQPGKQQKWLVTFTKDKGRADYGGVDFDGQQYIPAF